MTKVNKKSEMIETLLDRNVEKVYPSKSELKKVLASKKLRIKLGIDPTGSKIHIGRAVVLRKLREFQDLGHTIVLIIGDYTAQIGDPSDKLEKRPFLTSAAIKKNLKNYLPQIGKIIELKKVEIHYNSTWLKKFNLQEISQLAEQFTIQQMLHRRNFKERVKKNEDITMRELFYPLMQGYDSVAIKADVELGGTDQLFNLMAGRKIQERYDQKPQFVMTTKMLIGLDGRKMSTSWGNVINIADDPSEQFGKIMSMHDEYIAEYFERATDMPVSEIKKRTQDMRSGKLNPRDVKVELAKLLIEQYHSNADAETAEKNFIKTFQKKELPDTISIQALVNKQGAFPEKLFELGLVDSKSEAWRMVKQGAVKVNGKKVQLKDRWMEVSLRSGDTIQVGKRKFVRIK